MLHASGNTKSDEPLIIGISSSALFDLQESDSIFREQGAQAYEKYQRENESKTLAPGVAFSLVRKLLNLNQRLQTEKKKQWTGQQHIEQKKAVEIILLSRNSADTGLRVFNSIEEHKLDIRRAAFCSGTSPYRYIRSFGCHLFLSTHPEDVRNALQKKIAAAQLQTSKASAENDPIIHFAFDADAVVFSDQAEQVYREQGLSAFRESERRNAQRPLPEGPFADFLRALQKLQDKAPDEVRTALVTARDAPAHKRVILTLRDLDVRIDEMLFLGGQSKGDFLHDFHADIFFDDCPEHCDSAARHTAVGRVPPVDDLAIKDSAGKSQKK